MARSSKRNFGAEAAIDMPPPPLRCIPTSKENRSAVLAYAPCLPAAVNVKNKPKLQDPLPDEEQEPSEGSWIILKLCFNNKHSHEPYYVTEATSVENII